VANYSGKDVRLFLVDGYDLAPYLTEFSDAIEAMFEESHTLGDSWPELSYVDLRKIMLSVKGFYDDDALASNAALVAMNGGSRVICYGVEGNTLGNDFIGCQGAIEEKFQRVASRGALHKVSAEFKGNGQVDEGLIHFPLGAVSGSSGNGTAVDNGASSSDGGTAYFQVTALALGGYTNLALKIQDSSDNSTYADMANATAVTAAPDAEAVAVSGTVDRYTRFSHAFTGAGSGQSATVFAGFKRN
jgi:hypothetical protein